jgi:N-terminal domain of reverse transcriptase
VKVTMTTVLEPMGMLDAATTVAVNGPEDGLLDWDSIDWDLAEKEVRRLRQRIFTASRDGDLRKVRSLQRLMLRCRANAFVAVRRVAQQNAGRNTAGVDGAVALWPEAKSELVRWVQQRSSSWVPMPVRRVFIVRRVALRRIPCSAGRNSEGGFWVCWLTRS